MEMHLPEPIRLIFQNTLPLIQNYIQNRTKSNEKEKNNFNTMSEQPGTLSGIIFFFTETFTSPPTGREGHN